MTRCHNVIYVVYCFCYLFIMNGQGAQQYNTIYSNKYEQYKITIKVSKRQTIQLIK
jgi:hypothetical protein